MTAKILAVPPAVLILAIAVLVGSCAQHDSGGAASAADDKTLNLYNWSDYIAPDTISSFEKKTGIKVRVSY